MASSGTYTNNYKTGYSLQLRWETMSQDVANNTSFVNVETWMVNTYSTNSSATKNGSITINGSTGSYTFVVGNGVQNKKLFDRTVTVAHNSDGTKTVDLSTYADIKLTLDGTFVDRVTVSGSPTLDTIPRKSTFSTLPSTVTAGTPFNYAINRASSGFTHSIGFYFGGSQVWQTGVTTSGSYTVPLSLLSSIPNASSGNMTVYIDTYSGSTYIGENSYSVTVQVPSSVVPTITSVTAARVDGDVPPEWGIYVQGKSSATITINGAEGVYGSTITKYETKLGTTTKGNNGVFSLPSPGVVTFTGTVTDSRGRTASSTVAIDVVDYTPPQFSAVALTRSTVAGVAANDGTYGKINVDYGISTVSGNNTASTKVEYRLKGLTAWTDAGAFTDGIDKIFGGGVLSVNDLYDVQATITDTFSSVVWTGLIKASLITVDFLAGGHGIAFGKPASLVDTVESDFDFQLNGKLDVLGKISPIGGFETPRIPDGSNLNDYTTPGQWYNPKNVEVAGFTNKPPSNAAGTLVVMKATGEPGGEAGVTQLWYGYDYQGTGSKIYRRRLYSGTWSSWKLMNPAFWVGEASGGQRSGVTYYNVTLNFPSGLFSVAPKVFAQINNQAGGSNQLQVMTGNITASSCLVGFFMTTGTMNGHWCEADIFAIEPS